MSNPCDPDLIFHPSLDSVANQVYSPAASASNYHLMLPSPLPPPPQLHSDLMFHHHLDPLALSHSPDYSYPCIQLNMPVPPFHSLPHLQNNYADNPCGDAVQQMPSLVDALQSGADIITPSASSCSQIDGRIKRKTIRRNLERSMQDTAVNYYHANHDLQETSILRVAAAPPKSELVDDVVVEDSGAVAMAPRPPPPNRRIRKEEVPMDSGGVDVKGTAKIDVSLLPKVKKARITAANYGVESGDGDQKQQQNEAISNNKNTNLDEEAVMNSSTSNSRLTHITVERNRRKQMNEHLAILRSLMPSSYVQRADQASIIGGAVEFIKEARQLVASLEAQRRRRRCVEEAAAVVREGGGGRSGGGGDVAAVARTAAAQVEARVGGGAEVWVRVLCVRAARDQLLRLSSSLESLHLAILRLSVSTPHPSAALYSFTLKIGIDCRISVEELVNTVQRILQDIYSNP